MSEIKTTIKITPAKADEGILTALDMIQVYNALTRKYEVSPAIQPRLRHAISILEGVKLNEVPADDALAAYYFVWFLRRFN